MAEARKKQTGPTKEQKEKKAIAMDKLKVKLLKLKLKMRDPEADHFVFERFQR